MYGSEVLFIGKEILDFETVHLSFLKNLLGVKQQTTSVTIYGDTGRYPCRIHASLDYRDSRPRSPRTRRDSGMTASFQYSSAVCINPIAMRS